MKGSYNYNIEITIKVWVKMLKDSTKKKGKTTIDDGCAAFLVENAQFDGKWEIPIIYNNEDLKIPLDLVPFDKRNKVEKEKKLEIYIHFYMHDITFKQVIKDVDKYIDTFRDFGV